MKWCEREEPICAGTNKKNLVKEALRILRAEHGKGAVGRGVAMCNESIREDDIEITAIPFLSNKLSKHRKAVKAKKTFVTEQK